MLDLGELVIRFISTGPNISSTAYISTLLVLPIVVYIKRLTNNELYCYNTFDLVKCKFILHFLLNCTD